MTTTIEWTDSVWNPTVGCSRVSAGCEHCYAERVAHRGMAEAHRGLTVLGKKGPRWTGEVRFLPERLEEPLRWRKPRRVFVNSMSDLFHEGVPMRDVARVFAVMSQARQHVFQVLTKRPKRMRELLSSDLFWRDVDRAWCEMFAGDEPAEIHDERWNEWQERSIPGVWLGVSVEDQRTADERIPLLLQCPAAVWWVSYEPALGWVDFHYGLEPRERDIDFRDGSTEWGRVPLNAKIDWIVIGGESGPSARPFDLAWARSTIAQCRDAGVPVFVKQLGARPYERAEAWSGDAGGYDPDDVLARAEAPRPPQMDGWTRVRSATETSWYRYHRLSDRKGGDMSEWPEDLRVREWPTEVAR